VYNAWYANIVNVSAPCAVHIFNALAAKVIHQKKTCENNTGGFRLFVILPIVTF